MQTFLPYSNYDHSVRVLDRLRLNKQRVECLQICTAITDPEYGWQHHPAVNQWRGKLFSLAQYGLAVHAECERRGIADRKRVSDRLSAFRNQAYCMETPDLGYPAWLGDVRFHRSHRSNLLRKAPEIYGRFWRMRSDLEYFWPSKERDYAHIPGSTYKEKT
jgi:hypothetical protein